jgi:hypothetical protein
MILYERKSVNLMPKWYHAKAYYDACTNRELMVIFPFHYLVMFIRFLSSKWSTYQNKPSWLDKQIKKGIENERNSIR